MSEAPAAPVTENGVPPATQEKIDETPGFKVGRADPDVAYEHSPLLSRQVFAGNLAYSTTDEGLKAFFAPVQEDMYVSRSPCHNSMLTLVLCA